MTEIVKKTESPLNAFVAEFQMTEDELNTIINTIAVGATKNELKLFLHIAKKTGLDVFTRQIHFVKRKQKQKDGAYKEVATIQTGIDGYRAIAERSGCLAGIEDVVYDSEVNTVPKKATVTVYKMINGERIGFTASARWDEYYQRDFKTGKPSGLWAKMPYLMLGKCAEALALRKAFPNDLSGIYTHEEMSQATEIEPVSTVKVVNKPRIPKPNPVVEELIAMIELVEKPSDLTQIKAKLIKAKLDEASERNVATKLDRKFKEISKANNERRAAEVSEIIDADKKVGDEVDPINEAVINGEIDPESAEIMRDNEGLPPKKLTIKQPEDAK